MRNILKVHKILNIYYYTIYSMHNLNNNSCKSLGEKECLQVNLYKLPLARHSFEEPDLF